jgi:hypothetical protein
MIKYCRVVRGQRLSPGGRQCRVSGERSDKNGKVTLREMRARHNSHSIEQSETNIEKARNNKIIHLCEQFSNDFPAITKIAQRIAHQIIRHTWNIINRRSGDQEIRENLLTAAQIDGIDNSSLENRHSLPQ